MKKMKWVILVATVVLPLLTSLAQPQAPQPPPLSPAAAEVVKLAQAGTSDEVLLAYIQNSPASFDLSADQILYLKDVGVSQQAISSMLGRDQALRNQPQSYNYQQRSYAPTTPAPTAPPPAAPVASAPTPVPVPTEPAPPVPAPAPVYVSTPPADVTYFYSDLSPYGTWVDLPDYGWCWQPSVVVINSGWRPYCDAGHWEWTDAGWFWVSDYSWGWAPFHYGRWYRHERCGWVWTPDRVWGPAWVTWRTSGEYCGWAPLPPRAVFDVRLGWSYRGAHVGVDFDFGLHSDHFCFIGFGDFCSHDLGHRRLGPTEVTRVYNRTTIINNYTVNNTTIVNQGVKVERVAAATHTEIHKAAIRDLPAGSHPGSHQGYEKGTPVVYRPQLHTPAKPANMVAQKVDARHPVIQHTEMPAARSVVKTTPAPASTYPTSPGVRDTRRPEPAKSNSRSVTERPSAPRSDYAAPRTEPRVASTPEPAPARTPTPQARHEVEDTKPATRSLPNYRAPAETPTYPLHTNPNAWNTPRPGASQGQNGHSYYPKSFHQSADIRSLPPANSSSSYPSGGNSGSSSRKHQD